LQRWRQRNLGGVPNVTVRWTGTPILNCAAGVTLISMNSVKAVVDPEPGVGQRLQLGDRFEQARVENRGSIAAVEGSI